MIKHEEIEKKFRDAEKKLQSSYKLEIKTEVDELNSSFNDKFEEIKKRDYDIFNNFLSKFNELKEYRKETQIVIDNVDSQHNEYYRVQSREIQILQEEIAKINTAIQEMENLLDDRIDTQNVTFVHAQQEIENNQKVATKPADD